MYFIQCCIKSVSHLCNMGRSLLGGDKRLYPCACTLGFPTLFTDVDDPRLLGPTTTQNLHYKPRSMITTK